MYNLKDLNEYQKRAVLDNSRACLVNANVGSGKTTVLINKVFYLAFNKCIDFKEMIVLTFTNKAADEIVERITQRRPSLDKKDIPYFGTFHSIALKLLKSILPVNELGYSDQFSVVDPEEEIEIAERIIKEKQLRIEYSNKLRERLEKARHGKYLYKNMISIDDILKLLEFLRVEKISQDKMNFDDLLLNATNLLKNYELSPKWVIIDEFQDSDNIQFNFIKSLVDDKTKIFAVGDPNQIIYTWRGTNKSIFEEYKEFYNATELTLPINYRSTSYILKVAESLMDTKSVKLIGSRTRGTKISIKEHHNSFTQAQYLAEKIKVLQDQGRKLSEIAIFYRTLKQSEILKDVLERNDIPCEVSKNTVLSDSSLLSWLMKLIKASTNNRDMDNAIAVISNNSFGENFDRDRAVHIVKNKCLHESELYRKIASFRNWYSKGKNFSEIYDYFELDKYLKPSSGVSKESIENMLKVLDEYFHDNKNTLGYEGIKECINSIALYKTELLYNDIRDKDNSVKLMTLHSSKGLEFECVFIIGANQGLIPITFKDQESLEEEKRLFFVGITRAKDFLEISYCNNPSLHWVRPTPSDYLDLIPKNLLVESNTKKQKVNLNKYRKEILDKRDESKSNKESSLVSHEKYGIGKVICEYDGIITVKFEGYGEREFSKNLNSLKIIKND